MSFLIKNGKCRVKISFYFFALLCLAAFLDRGGVLLWGLFAALLHEGGHIVAMRLTAEGLPKEIRLTPFGVRIENSPLAETGRGRLGVLAAGSGMNFLCAAVTFGILPSFAAVSLVLGILNLLPVEGMDGGGILLLLRDNGNPLPDGACGSGCSACNGREWHASWRCRRARRQIGRATETAQEDDLIPDIRKNRSVPADILITAECR